MHALKITVAGLGYVGVSQAVLLAQNHRVMAIDVDPTRVGMINSGVSPVQDTDISNYLRTRHLDLTATTEPEEAYYDADFVVVAVPTDFDEEQQSFDTSAIEEVISTVRMHNKTAYIIIKSTVPIGYTYRLRRSLGDMRILFSPEFLRETKALYDNLFPSRIIVGADLGNKNNRAAAEVFAGILSRAAKKEDVKTYIMDLAEAESVKLFSNAYLAMRVSFFNELDTFAELNGLDPRKIIDGVCADSRIGDHYNNPSFGYGGYCLPKDTKQLKGQFAGVPESIFSSIVESNAKRKNFVAEQILAKATAGKSKDAVSGVYDLADDGVAGSVETSGKPLVIGIYGLAMKAGSDDFRFSAVQDVMVALRDRGATFLIYEPSLKEDEFIVHGSGAKVDEYFESPVVSDLKEFKNRCDVVIANRYDTELEDIIEKVYTRDLFRRD